VSLALHPTANLGDQVPVFMPPSDKVAQLYPPEPGSLFVAFYDSQGYGGGILTRLHTGHIKGVLKFPVEFHECRRVSVKYSELNQGTRNPENVNP
jgi:hypothetical protein